MALTAAGEPGATPLAARLLDLLPTDCRRVLLLAPDTTLAAALRARGCEVVAPAAGTPAERLAELLGGTSAAGGQPWRADAVIVPPNEARAEGDLQPLLEALRAVLAEKGRVVLALPSAEGIAEEPLEAASATPPVGAGAGPAADVAVVALSEAGFVVVRQERLADPSPPPGTGEGAVDLLAARRDDFRVREYQPGDEVQILPIFEGSFHVHRSHERWSWEYRENPHGNLTISEAFAENGQLVAHYAGYPVRFRDRGEPLALPALQVGDTFTLPGIRHVGRGPTSLLGRTVRHFYARFCARRVAFNYGFNTGNIQRFSMAFVGARRLEDIPYLSLPVPERRPAAPSRLERTLGGWRVERVERFDERWDTFLDAVGGDHGMLVERDARYLDWRYTRCPGAGYVTFAAWRHGRLAGWATFRRRDDRLRWGDALVDPGCGATALRALLVAALDLPEHLGVTRVETWGSPRPAWWRDLLLELGFEAQPEPDDLGLVWVPFELDPGAAFRDRLYYTMGDSDLF